MRFTWTTTNTINIDIEDIANSIMNDPDWFMGGKTVNYVVEIMVKNEVAGLYECGYPINDEVENAIMQAIMDNYGEQLEEYRLKVVNEETA